MGSRAAAPLGVGTLEEEQPPPLPLYILEVWGLPNTQFGLSLGAALPLSLLLSYGAW